MSATAKYPFYIGLPMWSHKAWQGILFPPKCPAQETLYYYSKVFNTVEGNTTFYALPSSAQVERWKAQLVESPDFRFSFKLSKQITHQKRLRYSGADVKAYFDALAPLECNMGPHLIQLPPTFKAEHLDSLEHFLLELPRDHQYSIELRHEDFFNKSDSEQRLNDLLSKCGVDRWSFDTRALFNSLDESEVTLEAKAKKPRFPPRANCFSKNPGFRFIAEPVASAIRQQSEAYAINAQYLKPWIEKIKVWQQQGLKPYIFLHLPNNDDAPFLGEYFAEAYREQDKSVDFTCRLGLDIAPEAEQSTLF